MTDPGEKISEGQRVRSPSPHTGLCLYNSFRCDMKHATESGEDLKPQESSQFKTNSDPAGGAQKRRQQCGDHVKMTLKGQIADKGKERFVRDGKPDDPKDQEEKDRDVPIVRDPRKAEVHK